MELYQRIHPGEPANLEELEMTEATAAQAKVKTVVTLVTMEDGREVGFAGKRQMQKSYDEATGVARFDFRNGKSVTCSPAASLSTKLIGHGLLQKIGDTAAGAENIDDAILEVEDAAKRMEDGEWGVTRTASDGFSGASFVIRAICEVSGKSVEQIKAFLQKKLDDAKAKGETLSRQKLYESFRAPGSKTGEIIAKLEAEKAAKKPAVSGPSAADLLGELEE